MMAKILALATTASAGFTAASGLAKETYNVPVLTKDDQFAPEHWND